MTLAAALVAWLALAPTLSGEGAASPRADATDQTDALVLAVQIDPALVSLTPSLLAHLRAELAAGRVVVVPADAVGGPAPNARLSVGAPAGSPVSVELDVEFLRSGTSVRHVVDLSSLPADGVALGIAIAVDELVRASWSLAGVSTPVRPTEPPPPSVSVAPPPPSKPSPSTPPRAEGRLLLAAVRGSDGTLALGPDAVFVFLIGARLGVDARVGWRGSGARAAPDGSIDGSAVTAGLGVSIALPPRKPLRRAGAELGAHLEGAWVTVRGSPNSGATARSASALGAAAVAGLGGWLALAEPLRVVAFVGWQLPLRAVGAVDGDALAARVYAAGPSVALGLGARF